jgi:polyribonucleotide nucleotidyltransferase
MNSKDYSKLYREEHKEYYQQKIKEWNEKNTEKVKEYRKQYYQKNKEKMIAHQLENVYCEACDRHYKRAIISAHKRTDKHIRNQYLPFIKEST